MTTLTALCTFVAVGILVVILSYIAMRGIGALNLRFLVDTPRPVGEGGGIGNAIVGSGLLLLLSCAVGIPVGLACGIYLSEFGGGWFASAVRFLIDTLTGIPSIVTGVFVYAVIVLRMKHFSAFSGGIALALIMIPIVARTTEEMLRLVPNSYRDASIALGATKARTVMQVVLPAAGGSIITGVMLAIARVAGETAPLLFTALGSRLLTLDPSHPFPSLTVQVFTYATGPYREEQNLAWAGMLILIGIIFALNLALRFTVYRLQGSRSSQA